LGNDLRFFLYNPPRHPGGYGDGPLGTRRGNGLGTPLLAHGSGPAARLGNGGSYGAVGYGSGNGGGAGWWMTTTGVDGNGESRDE
jgi:hypothetical protein